MAMKDVREQLSDLVKRATFRGETITFGPNRGDDVTLIATERVRRLEERLREAEEELVALRRDGAEPRPFAGLQAALDSGAITLRGDAPRQRRLLPGLASEAPLSREERIRLGSLGDAAPEFRRSRPRA